MVKTRFDQSIAVRPVGTGAQVQTQRLDQFLADSVPFLRWQKGGRACVCVARARWLGRGDTDSVPFLGWKGGGEGDEADWEKGGGGGSGG